ncbi:MAG: uroporphyrinogen decarboxylase [Alphaproteobacteria bacterium]|nr:uroporphyrinogen decarboxylase [Alphaproteobacteria bacterium]
MNSSNPSPASPINFEKPLLQSLNQQNPGKLPFWFMRQAGRYLPEYQSIRQKESDFIKLCLNPKLAAEITLQPIKRFDMDGAILFSDILIVPYILGQEVDFIEKFGPKLKPIRKIKDLSILKLDSIYARFQNIYETVRLTAAALPPDKTLIGFCGGIWTVASYMIEGQSSKTFETIKKECFNDSEFIKKLFEILEEASFQYLSGQIDHGCDAVQIFESWAGVCDEKNFNKYIIKPTERLIKRLRGKYPKIPIIWFPKNGCENFLALNKKLDINCIGLDYTVHHQTGLSLQKDYTVQGQLDPIALLSNQSSLESITRELIERFYLDAIGKNRYIFNLGHGILPNTPVENVEFLVKIIRSY